MYTAVVLNAQSIDHLSWVMRGTANLEKEGFRLMTPTGEHLPHHMTINLGDIDRNLNDLKIMGRKAILEIDAIFWSLKIGACAARVSEAFYITPNETVERIHSINDERSKKHITICLKEGVKPFKSNDLFSDSSASHFLLNDPVKLYGTVQVQ